MAYFDRTYLNIRDALALALAPGHFPVFTRSKNPNRLQGTRTGLTLQALAPFGVWTCHFGDRKTCRMDQTAMLSRHRRCATSQWPSEPFDAVSRS